MSAPMTLEEEIAMYRALDARRGRKRIPIEPRACAWAPCGRSFTPGAKRHARFCSKSCGMSASHARGDRKPGTVTLAERARAAGLHPNTVYARRFYGWSDERALSEPVQGGSRAPGSNFGGWR